jgi:hypothetical protein
MATKKWITVRDVHVTKRELIAHFGEKCSDYDRRCCVCQAWRQWEKTKRVDILIDRPTLLAQPC